MSEPGDIEGIMVYWTKTAVAGVKSFDGEALWIYEPSSLMSKKEKGFWGYVPDIKSVVTRGECVFIALESGKFVCLDLVSGGEVWSKDIPALKGDPILANKARRKAEEDDDSSGAGIALGMLGLGGMSASSR